MRILVVEDDDTLRGYIVKALAQSGFAAEEAVDARDAVAKASETRYHIVLLDVRLGPSLEDGNWVVRTLRQCGHHCAIIMITGQGGDDDKMASYDAGADDYLVKPFAIPVLIAKIQVWRKRWMDFLASDVSSTILAAGGLYINLLKPYAIFTEQDKEIPLTPNEFKILEYLFRRKGKAVTHAALGELLWRAQYDHNENAIESAIKRLRAKIDVPGRPSIIKTLRGSGYMIDDA